MIDRSVSHILASYGLNASLVSIQPLANAGGWSGSSIWRLIDQSGQGLALRRWPAEYPAKRLTWIQAVLAVVAPQLPIVASPLPTTTGSKHVEHGDRLWELSPWLQGFADYHTHPNRARLRAAMRALAHFHERASHIEQRRGPAPAIIDRQQRWQWMQASGLAAIGNELTRPLHQEIDRREIDRRALRLFEIARQSLQSTLPMEHLASAPDLWLQPAIRDIHHDHVLFTGDEVTGLIDFGAMRIDTPLTDIARLIGSLVGDNQHERAIAMDAYSELRPLTDADRRLIDLLDETGLVLGTLNWLTWLYVDRRDMGPVAPIIRRLDEILQRLERRAG